MSNGGPGHLRAVEPDAVGAALAATLAGGPPIAPLPGDPTERDATLTPFVRS